MMIAYETISKLDASGLSEVRLPVHVVVDLLRWSKLPKEKLNRILAEVVRQMEQQDNDSGCKPRDERTHLIIATVAACKEEVEGIVSRGVIEALDDGSPWARALFRMIKFEDTGLAGEINRLDDEEQHNAD